MIRLFSLVFVIVIGLSACNSMPAWMQPAPKLPEEQMPLDDKVLMDQEVGVVPSESRRFDDIPLPDDAKEDMNRTYVFQSGDIEVGKMVYTSRYRIDELTQFYTSELARSGWKLQRVMQAGNADLIFTKPGKRLTVSIVKMTGGFRRLITLNLTPETGSDSNLVPLQ